MRLQAHPPRLLVFAFLIGLASWTSACGGGEEEADVRVYTVRGVFIGPQYNGQAALINHERIPGYMDAMRMALRVASAETLAGIEPGAKIQFELVVNGDDAYVDSIERLPDSTALDLAEAPVREGLIRTDTAAVEAR